MSTENKNNFEWVLYVIGLLAGMLCVFAVTNHVGYIILGGLFGLLFTALFIHNIVRGREY
jgi:chromate transport protein ChrA